MKPAKLLRYLPLVNDTFTIPPNDSTYKVTASFANIFSNAHLWIIAPHMHLLGRSMKVSTQNQCLIDIEDWDFNWQGMYRYKDPIAVPIGATVSLEAHYDNSTGNVRNPNNPPKPVSWGEQTTDEMCIAFLGVTLDSENLATTGPVDTSWFPHWPNH